MKKPMPDRFKFNRMELAGSLGDLGTLLPIAIAMILINGISPLGLFFSIGVYYIISGLYFGITVPVQPMKVIGAYAIATAMSPHHFGVQPGGGIYCGDDRGSNFEMGKIDSIRLGKNIQKEKR